MTHATVFKFLFSLMLFNAVVYADVKTGAPAPEFSIEDSNGKKHTLAENKGKWVVLEWLNHGCPFVKKHYDSKNMQTLQEKYKGKGVVWYSVISSAAGKQGNSTPKQANAELEQFKAAPTAVLLDSKGTMGKAYGAATTPGMYVIDPKGVVVYQGAIDDKATTEIADLKTAKNYVAEVLDQGLANKPITVASTKSYGCSVKY